MAQNEFMSPKEYSEQYAIIQKLYAELDEEREASATAANEALSMILRLQVEKAAEKLEACQYKRLAEEKIHHAEESLAFLEELLYQKEIEIASLKLQVQTDTDRFSMASTSPTLSGVHILKIPPLRKADAFNGNMGSHGAMRDISLPIMSKKMCTEIAIIDEELLSLQMRQSISKYLNNFVKNINAKESVGTQYNMSPDLLEESDTRRMKANINSDYILEHCELQMSMPIPSTTSVNECTPCSWYSTASGNTLCDPMMKVAETSYNTEDASSPCLESKDKENFQYFDSNRCFYVESELPGNVVPSSRFHDIYEVPQDEYHNELKNELPIDAIAEEEGSPSTLHVKSYDWLTKELQGRQKGTVICVARKCNGLDYSSVSNAPNIGMPFHQCAEETWKTGMNHLEKRLQVLEDDRKIMKQENSDRKEQLKLLKEISEQLNMIQSQINKPHVKKHPRQDDISYDSLMEVSDASNVHSVFQAVSSSIAIPESKPCSCYSLLHYQGKGAMLYFSI